MNPNITLMTITPQMAEKYLATQNRNRKVRLAHVRVLSKAMNDGTFLYAGDPIRFNSKGELIDGQHRLLASIDSGKSFQAIVVRDIPNEAMDVIDTGLKRSMGDIFSLQGYTDANNLSATLRWLWRYDLGYMSSYPIKPQVAELKATMERHPKVKDSLSGGQSVDRLMVRSLGSALHCLFTEKDPKAGNDFFAKLHNGEGLFRGDPIYWLRTRLIKNASSKAKLPYHEVAAVTIKAFNMYRIGKKVYVLKWSNEGNNTEEFPTIE